jgi:hypothetical protein
MPMPSWRYEPFPSPRDLRLDLLRGLCLFKMVFNHLWHTPLHAVQSWIGFISAAEGFFFISGVVVGIVHGRRMHEAGLGTVSRAVLRRGLHLYASNLALVCLFLALEGSGVLPFGFLWNPGFTPPSLFSFNHPYFLQVLPRYAAFLAVTPLALYCLGTGRTAWLLAGSAGLWGLNLALGGRLAVPFLEAGEFGGFLLVAWQLLFFAGMVLGYHRDRLGAAWRALPTWAALGVPGALYLGFVLLERAVATGLTALQPGRVFDLFGRDHLGPGRLLNLAVGFAFFFAATDRLWRPVRRLLGPLLLPFGQSALYLFLVHILLNALSLAVELRLPFALAGHPWRLLAADAILLSTYWLMVRYRLLASWIPR